MKHFFTTTAAIVLLGTTASASSIGFDLTISNLLDNNGSATNVPLMTLNNTSSDAQITQFSFTIGDTAFNYDAVYFLNAPTGGTINATQGDDDDTGGTRVKEGILAFTGFDAGESANWRVDVDEDLEGDSLENYRTVLFNNGSDPNAIFTALFNNGMSLSTTATDEPSGNTSFTFSASQNLSAVPLPAGMPLLLAGVGAFAIARRRKS